MQGTSGTRDGKKDYAGNWWETWWEKFSARQVGIPWVVGRPQHLTSPTWSRQTGWLLLCMYCIIRGSCVCVSVCDQYYFYSCYLLEHQCYLTLSGINRHPNQPLLSGNYSNRQKHVKDSRYKDIYLCTTPIITNATKLRRKSEFFNLFVAHLKRWSCKTWLW